MLVSQTTNMSKARRAAGAEPASSEVTAQVFARPLHDGAVAVVLLNRGETAATLSVGWHDLGFDPRQPVAVRDVANKRTLPDAVGHFGGLVQKHDVLFVRFTPKKASSG